MSVESLGLVTPPFGSIMFVMCAIGKVSIYDFTYEVWPFVLVLIGVLQSIHARGELGRGVA